MFVSGRILKSLTARNSDGVDFLSLKWRFWEPATQHRNNQLSGYYNGLLFRDVLIGCFFAVIQGCMLNMV